MSRKNFTTKTSLNYREVILKDRKFYYLFNDGVIRTVKEIRCNFCGMYFYSRKNQTCCNIECSSEMTKLTTSEKIKNKLILSHYRHDDLDGSVVLHTNTGYRYTVDNADLDSIIRYTWVNDINGYLTTRIRVGDFYINLKLHRLIMMCNNEFLVDHINGNVSDNRLCNLRIANKSMNGHNRKNPMNCIRIKDNGSYEVVINVDSRNNKRKQKTFSTLKDAVIWRDAMKLRLISDIANDLPNN